MTDEQREHLIRVGAIGLLRHENPLAPASAASKPSKWWYAAEAVINAIEPHWNSL